MSEKGILIVDLPDGEDITDIYVYYDLWSNSREESIDVDVEAKLLPLPRLENNEQVYQMMTKHSAMCNVGTSTKFTMLRFIDGWESCLDEIEGK